MLGVVRIGAEVPGVILVKQNDVIVLRHRDHRTHHGKQFRQRGKPLAGRCLRCKYPDAAGSEDFRGVDRLGELRCLLRRVLCENSTLLMGEPTA